MSNFDEWKKQKDNPREEPLKENSFLIGTPIPWSAISQQDNRKEWIWENYIAKGHITLLSALWKAGKSTLLRCLFLAMAKEEEFAGQPTKKSRVLVLSEETKGDWSERREEIDEELIDGILIWSRPLRIKPNMRQWIETIKEVTKLCIEEKIDMVVIDTLSSFWPIDNENDSAQVLKALVPLYNFTENNIAVLLVHHFRKGGGDQAQASRGSGALPGFVSNIIEFTRKEDGFPTQRILKAYGRFDDVIPSVVINLTNDGIYETLGQPWEVSKSARLQKILDIFKESSEPLSAKEILNLFVKTGINITSRSIRSYLKDLLDKNILSAVENKLVIKRITPFYALKGTIKEQPLIENLTAENALPPANDTFPQFGSGTKNEELRKVYTNSVHSNNIHPNKTQRTAESHPESLSAVDPQTVPVTAERKGTSPKDGKNFGDI